MKKIILSTSVIGLVIGVAAYLLNKKNKSQGFNPKIYNIFYFSSSNNQSITFLWIIPFCEKSNLSIVKTYLG